MVDGFRGSCSYCHVQVIDGTFFIGLAPVGPFSVQNRELVTIFSPDRYWFEKMQEERCKKKERYV